MKVTSFIVLMSVKDILIRKHPDLQNKVELVFTARVIFLPRRHFPSVAVLADVQ